MFLLDVQVKSITGSERIDFIILGSQYLIQQGYGTGTQSVSALCEDVYNSSLSLEDNLNKLRGEY